MRNTYIENNDFTDALHLHGIFINTVNGNNDYIEFIQREFESQVDDFTKILNEESQINNDALDSTFSSYEIFLCNAMRDESEEIITGLVRIYSTLLSCCTCEEIVKKYVFRFSDFVLTRDIHNEANHTAWKTDMMILLAQRGRILNICMQWIISYFSRSKSSNIDLNRYKLEKFLMETDNEKINDMIIESVYE